MDLSERIVSLARLGMGATPVLSVYLNTRWGDEHQRDRTRLFVKHEIRLARQTAAGHGIEAAIEWVRTEGERLIEQARPIEAQGAALFACDARGLREILPVRVPFEDAFVVAAYPYLRPLVALLDTSPAALIAFVDGESARLVPLGPEGEGPEVRLESEVPGHHRRGGWAQLAQSRYQRHIQDHRGRHFEAVAATLEHTVDSSGVERIVLAGEARNLGAFRKHLSERLTDRLAGSISATRHEPASLLTARAGEALGRVATEAAEAAVAATLTQAAKGGLAVAGLEPTLGAVARGAVHRLYLLRSFARPGQLCSACGALQPGAVTACGVCQQTTHPVDLGDAMLSQVISAGGDATVLADHAALTGVGGVAARLRYAV